MEAVGEQLSSRDPAFWALQTVIYLHEELKRVQRGKNVMKLNGSVASASLQISFTCCSFPSWLQRPSFT